MLLLWVRKILVSLSQLLLLLLLLRRGGITFGSSRLHMQTRAQTLRASEPTLCADRLSDLPAPLLLQAPALGCLSLLLLLAQQLCSSLLCHRHLLLARLLGCAALLACCLADVSSWWSMQQICWREVMRCRGIGLAALQHLSNAVPLHALDISATQTLKIKLQHMT